MSTPRRPSIPDLFEIIKYWLEFDDRIDWNYASTNIGHIGGDKDSMIGSIWIKHYVIIHVYKSYVVVIHPYHSMDSESITISALDQNFFDELYKVLVNATSSL
jgi:hypothetical protein